MYTATVREKVVKVRVGVEVTNKIHFIVIVICNA